MPPVPPPSIFSDQGAGGIAINTLVGTAKDAAAFGLGFAAGFFLDKNLAGSLGEAAEAGSAGEKRIVESVRRDRARELAAG